MSLDAEGGYWAEILNPRGLSQGDILKDIPIGAPWAPLVFLGRDAWTHPTRGTYYPKRDQLEQFKGDPGGLFIAKGRILGGLVITHNCDLDDAGDTARILVAPVAPLAWVSNPEHRTRILERKRRAFVPLPSLADVGDCYADLRSIAPLDRSLFTTEQRHRSMSDESVLLLRAQLIEYFTRMDTSKLRDALRQSLAAENQPPEGAAGPA